MSITNEALKAAIEALDDAGINIGSNEVYAALEASAPHMKFPVTDESFGYAVSAILGHGDFTTAEAEAAVHDIINALGRTA